MVLALSGFAANVETDRAWYVAGEAMKVSITADNALIAYAELCDTHGLVAGVMVELKGGAGQGLIELPSDLHSGYYLLSAYTRSDAQVSQQYVAVINPLRKSVDDDIEWVEAPTSSPSPSRPSPSPSLVGRGVDSSADSTNDCKPSDSKSIYSPPYKGGAGGGSSSLFREGQGVGLLGESLLGESLQEPEIEGHIIRARVKNVHEGQTFIASQIRPSLSIIGKQIHFFEGKMVNDSIAVFYTFGLHGKLPLVLSALSSTDESLPIELISPFAAFIPKTLPHLEFHYNRIEVEARSIAMQRRQRSLSNAPLGSAASLAEERSMLDYDDTVFGTKPDLSYNLDEYRQFLTVREVLLEYVICVKNTKINGVPRLLVRKEQEVFNTSLPSLVLIDGMPVNDVERLLNYDARRIHYINIYGGQYTFGNGLYNGILSFVTRSGQLTNYPTERNMQYLLYAFPE